MSSLDSPFYITAIMLDTSAFGQQMYFSCRGDCLCDTPVGSALLAARVTAHGHSSLPHFKQRGHVVGYFAFATSYLPVRVRVELPLQQIRRVETVEIGSGVHGRGRWPQSGSIPIPCVQRQGRVVGLLALSYTVGARGNQWLVRDSDAWAVGPQ